MVYMVYMVWAAKDYLVNPSAVSDRLASLLVIHDDLSLVSLCGLVVAHPRHQVHFAWMAQSLLGLLQHLHVSVMKQIEYP